MAETKESFPTEETPPPLKQSWNLSVLVAALHSTALLAALGILVYTRLIYHRPPITEQSETQRLTEHRDHKAKAEVVPGLISFDVFTANLSPLPAQPKATEAGSRQIQGKNHYATVSFSLEIQDESLKEEVESIRPALMDEVLSLIGRKDFNELNQVQGRYLLRSQIIDASNRLLKKRNAETQALITHLYFNQFTLQ